MALSNSSKRTTIVVLVVGALAIGAGMYAVTLGQIRLDVEPEATEVAIENHRSRIGTPVDLADYTDNEPDELAMAAAAPEEPADEVAAADLAATERDAEGDPSTVLAAEDGDELVDPEEQVVESAPSSDPGVAPLAMNTVSSLDGEAPVGDASSEQNLASVNDAAIERPAGELGLVAPSSDGIADGLASGAVEEAPPYKAPIDETSEVPVETDIEIASAEVPSTKAPVEVEAIEAETVEAEPVKPVETEPAEPKVAVVEDVAPEASDVEASDVEVDVAAVKEAAPDVSEIQSIVLAPSAGDVGTSETGGPTLDLVRVAADGSTVIAGRAEPNSVVRITADGQPIAEIRATNTGESVALTDTEVTKSAQRIELLASIDGGPFVRSSDSVIVLGRAVEDLKGPAPEAETEIAPEAVDVAAVATGPAVEDEPAQAPAVLATSGDQIRVLQPPSAGQLDRVSLDSIEYDEVGNVVLAGRGRAGMAARAYADGRPLADAKISDGGTWKIELTDLDAGRYVLRIDEIDADGKVASRAESPFQREFPTAEKLALLTSDQEVIVQPGNNLWNIAKGRYGEGVKFWVICNANADQIRDPDLIFPGQIFELPEE